MTQYMPLFRLCSSLRLVSQLHANLLITGRLRRDPLPVTKLIESYAFMGSPDSSRLVFEGFLYPDSFMYGVLIKCNVWCHLLDKAIDLYHKLVLEKTQISKFVFPSVLRACAGLKDRLGVGKKVHGRIIKSGLDEDAVIETSLLCLYGKTGNLVDAEKMFDGMSVRDLVAWSTLVSSCLENGEVEESLRVFKCMVNDGVEPDVVTMISVVEGCGELGCLRIARSVHAQITRKMFDFDETLSNVLLTMYSKCGDLFSSERIFEKMVNKNTVSWTAMISSYNRNEFSEKALRSFSEMLKSGIEPNLVTLYCVLSSCGFVGLMKEGKSVHGFAVRRELDPKYESLSPALVELYAECGRLRDCETVLRAVGDRNIVSWNSLISLYAHRGMVIEALCLFREMVTQLIRPDSFTLASTISACENADLIRRLGKQIHGHVIRTDVSDEFVQNSVIDMYSKSGFVDSAYTVFVQIKHKSVVTWNSMLCGFSQNGNSLEAINMFDYMYCNCLQMNEVTFLAVIQACSSIGSLEKGKWVHHKLIMSGLNDLFTNTALIDMYAKCGDLNTAVTVFKAMSSKSIVSWSSMINAYGMHGHIESAISTFNQMVESGRTKPNEVVFMNVLSACGHSGSVKEGKYYFNLMKSFGISPNSEHFACFIDLLSRSGDLKEAYRTINEMPFLADASVWGSLVNGCRIHQRMDIIKAIKNDLSDIVTDDIGYYTLLSNIYAEEGEWEEFRRMRSVMKSSNLKKVPGFSAIEINQKVFRFGAGEETRFQTEELHKVLENFQNLTLEADYLTALIC